MASRKCIFGECVFCGNKILYDSKDPMGVGFCEIKAKKINKKLYPKHYVLFHNDCYYQHTRGAKRNK